MEDGTTARKSVDHGSMKIQAVAGASRQPPLYK
jgi:hypothetical protein